MKKVYLILAGLSTVHLIILLNLRFTAWPEIFSFPYLFNNGFNLYKDMIHPYTPLLTVSLSVIYKIFGYNIVIVKVFTYFIILINDLLIFKIVTKITKNEYSGIVAVMFYLLTQPFLEGNQLWFDLAIVPFILLGYLLLVNQKLFLSGLAFGLAFLTKQNTALFIIFTAFVILIINKKISDVLKFITFPSIILILLIFILFISNSVYDFFNWVLIYPAKYWTSFPNYVQTIPSIKQILILLTIFIPVIFLFLKNKLKNHILLLGSIFIAIILIYPRFSFFHFQVGIALLATSFGVAFNYFDSKKYLILYLLILFSLPIHDWSSNIRFIDDNDLKVIQNEKIYFLGPHSLNYVVSNSLPPKPWIDNFGWYIEIPNIQQKMLDGWKIDPPTYVYWSKPQDGNWYDLGSYQPEKIVKYIRDNYQKIDEQRDVEVWKLKQK